MKYDLIIDPTLHTSSPRHALILCFPYWMYPSRLFQAIMEVCGSMWKYVEAVTEVSQRI